MLGQRHLQEEDTTGVRRVGLELRQYRSRAPRSSHAEAETQLDTHGTHNRRLPLEKVVADGTSRARAGGVASEVDELLGGVSAAIDIAHGVARPVSKENAWRVGSHEVKTKKRADVKRASPFRAMQCQQRTLLMRLRAMLLGNQRGMKT